MDIPPPNTIIREAQPEDARPMIELLNPIIQTGKHTAIENPITLEEQVEFIKRFPKGGVFHVAVCTVSKQILGMQDVVPLSDNHKESQNVGEISTYVSLETQRKGIGQQLSDATFHSAQQLGFKKIIAVIRKDNHQALSFYKKHGFKTIKGASKQILVNTKNVDLIRAEKILAL